MFIALTINIRLDNVKLVINQSKKAVEMEAPQTRLKNFSAILIQEYIRQMAVFQVLQSEGKATSAYFNISQENYQKMLDYPLQTALIGLHLEWQNNLLQVTPGEKVLQQYTNKIMREVLQTFAVNYQDRYTDFITLAHQT